MHLPRTIFDKPPRTWQQLETYVAQLFREMRCDVSIRKMVTLPRGSVVVDVLVHDTTVCPPTTYIVECKHWSRAIPKSIVHAFRTVLTETGSHRGFIVSTCGFQAGAREAASQTNIDLLSWTKFQELFFDRWLLAATSSWIERVRLVRLQLGYQEDEDPSGNELWRGRDCIDDRAWEERAALCHRFSTVTLWGLVASGQLSIESFVAVGLPIGVPRAPATLKTYRELIDWFPVALSYAEEAVSEFFQLRTHRR